MTHRTATPALHLRTALAGTIIEDRIMQQQIIPFLWFNGDINELRRAYENA
ncbi:MAG TPA: hypothetical protein VFN37_09215 [Candidatus Baltobacteraceae bacterium]|nr:hypothetical protein [Candidatus Baltobacteraceae bacterium]